MSQYVPIDAERWLPFLLYSAGKAGYTAMNDAVDGCFTLYALPLLDRKMFYWNHKVRELKLFVLIREECPNFVIIEAINNQRQASFAYNQQNTKQQTQNFSC